MVFKDRREAGKKLAEKLTQYTGQPEVIVLGLARGGVEVAYEVAITLHVTLDVMTVRKLGAPGQEELAMGAIASGGTTVLNEDVIGGLDISKRDIQKRIDREKKELERREKLYRSGRPPLNVKDQTVILVDDGIATGSSMYAAIQGLKKQKPKRLVVAVPVAAAQTYERFKKFADEIICLYHPADFFAVGQFYNEFLQTTDDKVQKLLSDAHKKESE